MNRLVNLISSFGWSMVVFIFFLVVLSVILVCEIKSASYRNRSVEHMITVDLKDNLAGGPEIEAIRKNLSHQTYQPVYAERVESKDSNGNVFKLKVSCPPERFGGLLKWLRSRRWVQKIS